jgi:hypothetical protein
VRFRRALTFCAGAIFLAACTGDPPGATDPGPAFPTARAEIMVEAICDIDRIGRPSDRAAAVFFGDAHLLLHELAAAAEPHDRPAAARLLEAKAAVEGWLEGGTPSVHFPRAVDALVDAVAATLDSVGTEAAISCRP